MAALALPAEFRATEGLDPLRLLRFDFTNSRLVATLPTGGVSQALAEISTALTPPPGQAIQWTTTVRSSSLIGNVEPLCMAWHCYADHSGWGFIGDWSEPPNDHELQDYPLTPDTRVWVAPAGARFGPEVFEAALAAFPQYFPVDQPPDMPAFMRVLVWLNGHPDVTADGTTSADFVVRDADGRPRSTSAFVMGGASVDRIVVTLEPVSLQVNGDLNATIDIRGGVEKDRSVVVAPVAVRHEIFTGRPVVTIDFESQPGFDGRLPRRLTMRDHGNVIMAVEYSGFRLTPASDDWASREKLVTSRPNQGSLIKGYFEAEQSADPSALAAVVARHIDDCAALQLPSDLPLHAIELACVNAVRTHAAANPQACADFIRQSLDGVYRETSRRLPTVALKDSFLRAVFQMRYGPARVLASELSKRRDLSPNESEWLRSRIPVLNFWASSRKSHDRSDHYLSGHLQREVDVIAATIPLP
ncbi:MAG: hypothetical protein JNL80_03035 [Phycisphaerae bacterium]|nr:hypothetical protein [Phycisphaerae bacterium]